MAKDVYQIVTDRIVSQLEQGVIPWRMPWSGGYNGAVSYTTGRPYSFLNQMLLGESGEYLTFNQVKALGGNVAKGAVLQKDLTLKDCWIAKRGNFFAHGDTLHAAVDAVNAKWRENRPLDERIAEFVKTHPSLDEEYGDLFAWHHTLTGSCEFGRRNWCEEHGYKPADSITLRTFFEKTKDDYGGDVIRLVAKEYGIDL